MRPEDLIVATNARGADASKAFEVPGTGPRRWTVAEAGMACAGTERKCYFAIRYSYAGDMTCYHELFRELKAVAALNARVERWPNVVSAAQVAGLVLAYEASPGQFSFTTNRPDPRRLALSLPLHTWKRHGLKAFGGVHSEYRTWIDDGCSVMRRWMRRGRM